METTMTNYFKEYRIKNREKLDNYKREWVKNNLLAVKKYHRTYYKKQKIEKLKKQNEKIEAFKKNINEP